nr:hypothetical protein K-LCC10_0135 [Kaumoebavirus]
MNLLDFPPEILLGITDSYAVVAALRKTCKQFYELIATHTNFLVKKLLRYTYIMMGDHCEKVWRFDNKFRHGRAIIYKMSLDGSYCYLESDRNYQWGKLHGKRSKYSTTLPHLLERECHYNRGQKHGIDRSYIRGNLFHEKTLFRGKTRGLEAHFYDYPEYCISMSGRQQLDVRVIIKDGGIIFNHGKEQIIVRGNRISSRNRISGSNKWNITIEEAQEILNNLTKKIAKSKHFRI